MYKIDRDSIFCIWRRTRPHHRKLGIQKEQRGSTCSTWLQWRCWPHAASFSWWDWNQKILQCDVTHANINQHTRTHKPTNTHSQKKYCICPYRKHLAKLLIKYHLQLQATLDAGKLLNNTSLLILGKQATVVQSRMIHLKLHLKKHATLYKQCQHISKQSSACD